MVTFAARSVLALGLLLLVGSLAFRYHQAVPQIDPEAVWLGWSGTVLAGGTFLLVTFGLRSDQESLGMLCVEGLLALAIAAAPPITWVQIFGISLLTNAAANGGAQPLALAWLAIVVSTIGRQHWRERATGHPARA